jgi:predicted adenylyl cyclase CyaB
MFENKTFKITIDRVKNLGIFVEIEWRGDAKEKKNAITECLKMANKLGLKKVQDKGYLRLLEEKSTLKIKK